MSDPKDAEEREDKDVEAPAAAAKPEERRAAEPSTGRDEDDQDEDEDEDEEDPEATRREIPAAKRAGGSRDRGGAAKASKAPAGPSAAARIAPAAIVALVLGGAGGWFGHEQQAKAKLRTETAAAMAAPVGSGSAAVPAGPCGAWQTKICASGGEKSEACFQAKSAVELLTPASCETALGVLPATLTKIKASRAVCDKLVTKLCGDLEPGSKGCSIVKEQTPSFPAKRCSDLMEHYDQVIGELKRMDQQQAGMGAPGMGAPGQAHGPDDGHGH